MTPGPTVFFLSDYGTQDEFAGVVRAVLAAGAPEASVIDLTHQIEAFDVRAGAHALLRAVPHLPAGIVLAVVDPGVGTARRGLCLEVDAVRPGPTVFVGPDNGLLVEAAEWIGGGAIARAVALRRRPTPEHSGDTFDGRDLFAPAVARLCDGAAPDELGDPIDPGDLVRLFDDVVEQGRDREGRSCLRCEVTWVDRFGNVQLAATAAHADLAGIPTTGSVELHAPGAADNGADGLPPGLVPGGTRVRRVATFADLARGELGLLVDANGHLAVVAGEASAAAWLNVAAGELVIVTW
jgi:S-adenosylmethionine hydrolase